MYIYSEIFVFILLILSFYISKSNIWVIEFPHFLRKCLFFALSPLNSYQMQFRRFKAYKYDFFNTGHYHIHYQSWFLIAEHRSVHFAHFFCFYSSFYLFFLAPQNLVLFLNHSTTIRRGLWDFDWGTVVTLALSIPVSICLFFKNI